MADALPLFLCVSLLVDTWHLLIFSLVDALLLRSCWLFYGRCFAAEVALVSSLANTLSSLLKEVHLVFSVWMLCYRGYNFYVGNPCVDVSFVLTGSVCFV